MERVTERGFVCCNGVTCAVVMSGGEGGKRKCLQKGILCAIAKVVKSNS
jgi:hypothetical protein